MQNIREMGTLIISLTEKNRYVGLPFRLVCLTWLTWITSHVQYVPSVSWIKRSTTMYLITSYKLKEIWPHTENITHKQEEINVKQIRRNLSTTNIKNKTTSIGSRIYLKCTVKSQKQVRKLENTNLWQSRLKKCCNSFE